MKLFAFIDVIALKSDDWSDYLLPSAVSEFKQIVKSKIFGSALLVGAILFFFTAIGLYIFPDHSKSGQFGFIFFNFIMDVGLMIVIPLLLYQNMSTERANGSFELMSITSITPLKIILGKWQSGLMQSLVFGSIILPGLIYSYFFNGISISTVFISFFITVFFSQIAILLSIFFCSLGAIKASRLLYQIDSMVLNILIFLVSCVLKYEIIFYDDSLVAFFSKKFLLVFSILLIFIITIEAFLFAVSAAKISSYSVNKSFWPRIFYCAIVLEMVICLLFSKSFYLPKLSDYFIIILFVHFMITYFFLLENDELPLLLYRKLYVKCNPFLHFTKRFFYPGRSSAFLLFIVQTSLLLISIIYYFMSLRLGLLNIRILNSIAIVNCFVFYICIIYLSFCFMTKLIPQIRNFMLILVSFVMILLTFFLPLMISFYFKSLGPKWSAMNVFMYFSYSRGNHWIELNCFLTGIVLFIALSIAIIKDNRKIVTIRKYYAGDRSND